MNDCFRLLLGLNERNQFFWPVICRQLLAVDIGAGRQKIGSQSRSLLCKAGTLQLRIFVLRFVQIAEHPSDLMIFFRNGVWPVFCGLGKFQNPVFPNFRELGCTQGCQLCAEFVDGAETLGDRRIEWEQGADHIDRDRFGRCIVGLGVEKQTVPEMMRIFRLIQSGRMLFGTTW